MVAIADYFVEGVMVLNPVGRASTDLPRILFPSEYQFLTLVAKTKEVKIIKEEGDFHTYCSRRRGKRSSSKAKVTSGI